MVDGWLLYGAGLRLRECLKLRIKDVDFEYRQITVRDGKGGKDRVTMLPGELLEPLRSHVAPVKSLHEHDPAEGFGTVELPFALERSAQRRDSPAPRVRQCASARDRASGS